MRCLHPGVTCVTLLALVVGPQGSQGSQGPQAPHTHSAITAIPLELLQRPAALRDGIGVAREPITTPSEAARLLYDQGLACLHSFEWIEASRAFHAALRLDPQLAMAHVGLSYAFAELGSAEGARKAIEAARGLAARVSRREQLRIALRIQELDALTGKSNMAAYRTAVDAALAQFPDDVALLLLRGKVEDAEESNRALSGVSAAVRYYERAITIAPDQFAAHHYLIHTFENAGLTGPALEQAEIYARMAPAVPHAHHMLGHGLRRAGRTREAIAEFRTAEALASAYYKTEKIPPEYDWHHHHNWSLLAASYRYLGQMRAARELLQRAFASPAPLLTEEVNKRDWPAFLLSRGADKDAVAAARQLAQHASPLVRAAGHMAAAHALMARAEMRPAAVETDAALEELRAAGPEAGALAAELRLLQGEFFLRGGERDKGRTMIREAVAELRSRIGPDPWTQTLFVLEASVRAAREGGDGALASELAEQMRQHDAGYAGTHYALALAAEARGDRAAAARSYNQALQAWSDADPDLPESKQARSRLTALNRPAGTK
jgi:tetratricopeptide (TPR) repeat protein